MSAVKAERGVTLIELMVALSLLAVILASLLAVFESIRSFSQSSSNLTVATLDAQDVMQELAEYDYEDLLKYTPAARENLRAESITVAVTDESGGVVAEPLPSMVKIMVRVNWEERGADLNTSLSTLRARGF